MITRPDPIETTDEERRVVAQYMGRRGLAKRADIKEMMSVIWKEFLLMAQEHDEKLNPSKGD